MEESFCFDATPNLVRAELLAMQCLGVFTRERPLDSTTEADADGYKAWPRKNYAPASASVDLRRARQFLKAADRRRLIPAKPFSEETCGSQVNDERRPAE